MQAELSNLVGQEKAEDHASSSKPTPAAPPQAPVDTAMLRRLNELKEEYSAARKTAKEEFRAKRFERGLLRINELIGKVEAGKPVNENEIPVSLKASQPAVPPPASAEVTPPVPRHRQVQLCLLRCKF
ncbi:unnamed protein product [Gongylonema pulchrum]|uniref:DM14 domain-containing protein n=1 Tax=Gongylonema pulchrum TaxID=637853 RepID=A0A183EJH6_9BILA|nr:unnamed protein product [Gongylonema pulchrum]